MSAFQFPFRIPSRPQALLTPALAVSSILLACHVDAQEVLAANTTVEPRGTERDGAGSGRNDKDRTETLGEVVVTGVGERQNALLELRDDPKPITVVAEEDLKTFDLVNLQDVLRRPRQCALERRQSAYRQLHVARPHRRPGQRQDRSFHRHDGGWRAVCVPRAGGWHRRRRHRAGERHARPARHARCEGNQRRADQHHHAPPELHAGCQWLADPGREQRAARAVPGRWADHRRQARLAHHRHAQPAGWPLVQLVPGPQGPADLREQRSHLWPRAAAVHRRRTR